MTIPSLMSTSLKSVLIPVKDDSRMKKFAKRIKSCRPLGMFKLSKDEFLLCYDGACFVVCFGCPRIKARPQCLGCMSTVTGTLVALTRSSGKARWSGPSDIILISSSSTADSSKSVMQTPAISSKLSLEIICGARTSLSRSPRAPRTRGFRSN